MREGLLSLVTRKLVTVEPPVGSLRRASVSIILKDRIEPSTLLIKRAERVGDPWSGQVAFPGGKSQEGDASLKGTAIRETREEVGLDLGNAEFLGYFASFRTHTGTMDVVPSVFLLNGEAEVYVNDEVSSFRWVKIESLGSKRRASSYRIDVGGITREMPAMLVDDYVVWGLTHRIITSLLE